MIDQHGNDVVDRTGHRLQVGDRVGSWRRDTPGTVLGVEWAVPAPGPAMVRVLHDGDKLSTSYPLEGSRADLFLLNVTPSAVSA